MEKFAMWQKWFWIGLVISIISPIGGLVYGIALALEPGRKKEGLTICIVSVVMTVLVLSLVPTAPNP